MMVSPAIGTDQLTINRQDALAVQEHRQAAKCVPTELVTKLADVTETTSRKVPVLSAARLNFVHRNIFRQSLLDGILIRNYRIKTRTIHELVGPHRDRDRRCRQ